MARINHCHRNHHAKAYWLRPKNKHVDYEILLEAVCSLCQKTVLEYYGFHLDKGNGPVIRIPKKQHEYWLQRKNTDLEFYQDTKGNNLKDTRKKVFVGEYTIRISRNIAYQIKD